MATIQITREDIIQWLKDNKYFEPEVEFTVTKDMALKMSLKELGCFVACDSLNFRSAKDAIENANLWLEKKNAKKEIIKQWFGTRNIYDL